MNQLPESDRQKALALMAAGHSNAAIQRQTGIDRHTVGRYRTGYTPKPRSTANDAACRNGHAYPANLRIDTNGWHYCTQCRRDKGKRWRDRNPVRVQPDEVAILRAVDGDPPQRLTPRERTEAVRRMTTLGLSVATIAARLRCHRDTVHRARARLKDAA